MEQVIVIAVLVALIGWQEYQNRKERNKLINALLSKDAKELRELEFIEKVKPEPMVEKQPEIISVDQLTDDEFDKFIDKQNG